MTNKFKKFISTVLSASLVLSGVAFLNTNTAYAESGSATVLSTDKTSPDDGNVFLEVPGSFPAQDIQAAVARINEIRREACDEGLAYPSELNGAPSTTRTLTSGDYTEVQWSAGLEYEAIIRAAEYSLIKNDSSSSTSGHVRPNEAGLKFSSIGSFNGTKTYLESLGAGPYRTSLLNSIESWYNEKKNYQNGTGEYGHYQVMISPYINYVGMADFYNSDSSLKYYTTAEFSHQIGASDTSVPVGYSGNYIQIVEVGNKYITNLTLKGKDYYSVGDKYKLTAEATTSFRNGYKANVNKGLTWSSSNNSVATVNASTGEIEVVGVGNVKISASLSSGSVSADYIIDTHPKGTTIDTVKELQMLTVEYKKEPVLPDKIPVTLTDETELDLPVTWESYDKTLLVTGKDSVEFEIGGMVEGIAVSQKVHVNPIPMEIQNFKRTVDSGTRPVYPTGTAVILGKETVEFVDVTWNKTDAYKTREGGTFTETGDFEFYYDGEVRQYQTTMTITVNPATIKSYSLGATEVTTDSGVEPVYPKASFVWTNGDKESVDITWSDTAPTETSRKYMAREGGSYNVSGICRGYSTTLKVKVNPAYATKAVLSSYEVETKCGKSPVLPKTAEVTWSNGDVSTENVTWSAIDSALYSVTAGNEFNVSGTCCGITLTEKVTVIPKLVDSISIKKLPGKISFPQNDVQYGGDSFSDGVIHVVYNNDDEEDVSFAKTAISGFDISKTGNQTVKVTYGGKSETFTATVTTPVVTKTYVTPPSTVNYAEGEVFSTSGMKINLLYDNGLTDFISISNSDVSITFSDSSALDSELSGADKTLVVMYKNEVIRDFDGNDITIGISARTGIRVKTVPTKSSYIEGQALDISGLVLESVFANGSSSVIPSGAYSVSNVSGYDSSVIGKQTVTITVYGKTTTFDVNVRAKKISSIEVTSAPTKQTYVQGQTVEIEGLKVKATYDNGTNGFINVTSDNICMSDGTEANTASVGANVPYYVVVSDNTASGKPVKASFNLAIEAKRIDSVSVKTQPGTDSIIKNLSTFVSAKQTFGDGVLTATYNDIYTEEVSFSDANVTLSGFDIATVGTQSVTVSYGGKKATFDVTVTEPTVNSMSVTAPSKTTYTKGESLDMSGASIVVSLNNGRTESYALNDETEMTELNTKYGYTISAQLVDSEGKAADTSTAGIKTLKVFGTDGSGVSAQINMVGGKPVKVQVNEPVTSGGNAGGTVDTDDTEGTAVAGGTDGTSKAGGADGATKSEGTDGTTKSGGTEESTGAGTSGKSTSSGGVSDVSETDSTSSRNGTDSGIGLGESVSSDGSTNTVGDIGQNGTENTGNSDEVGADSVQAGAGNSAGEEYLDNSTGKTDSDSGIGEAGEEQSGASTDLTNPDIINDTSDSESAEKTSLENDESGDSNNMSTDPESPNPNYSDEWINGKWYDQNGNQTYSGTLSWKSNATGWWVEDSAGWYPANSWQKIDGVWYYFKPDGYMAMNEYYSGYWFNNDGSWDSQYFLSWKNNTTGWWVEDKSGWWPSSKWLKINGDWYYFNSTGYMATSQYVDGYWIGSDGVCQ